MTNSLQDNDTDYINDVIAGYYRLLAAVILLAERDAKLNPDKYQHEVTREEAQAAKFSAEWFLSPETETD